FRGVASFTDDVQIVLGFDEPFEAVAKHGVVVGDEYANAIGRHHWQSFLSVRREIASRTPTDSMVESGRLRRGRKAFRVRRDAAIAAESGKNRAGRRLSACPADPSRNGCRATLSASPRRG